MDLKDSKNQGPMSDLDDEIRYGDILQPNAHDALALTGTMGILDKFAACQTKTLAEMAQLNVTVFDIRVTKGKDGKWHGFHGPCTSNKDAMEEIKKLITLIKQNQKTIYTLKLKIKGSGGPSKYLNFIQDLFDADPRSMDILATPSEIKSNSASLSNVSLRQFRKSKRNLVVVLPKKDHGGQLNNLSILDRMLLRYIQYRPKSTTKFKSYARMLFK